MAKVFIYPANNHENQYVNIQEKAMKMVGLDVTYSLRDFFSTGFFLLNWFETLGGDVRLDYVKKRIKLFLCALFRKKILWVVHNRQPHAKYGGDSSTVFSLRLMRRLLRQAARIIILCDETYTVLKGLCDDESVYREKIYKIPHPNYIGSYQDCGDRLRDNKLKFLYIGQVNRYKNVDLLIDVFNGINDERVCLSIAGNCKDKAYIHELEGLVRNKNISCDFRFIPDDELVQYVTSNDILVLPYSLESSLNSGTIFLAFSCRRTVVSPLIGTLKEYGENNHFFYSYEYRSPQEHREKLASAIHQVIADYSSDSEILKEKGLVAYGLVAEQNSLEQIAERYRKLFAQF